MLVSFDDVAAAGRCAPVIDELRDGGVMVLISCPEFSRRSGAHPVPSLRPIRNGTRLAALATDLVNDGYAAVRPPKTFKGSRRVAYLRTLATALGIDKVVICDERGGIQGVRGVRSFVTSGALSRMLSMRHGGGGWTRGELSQLLETVRSGVESVNLTDPSGLADELFTYEGTGTLLTAHEYCTVGKLGVNDFREALDLLARGEREGFLLKRSDAEKAELLLSAYGARFEHRRLAGLAGLEVEAYRRQKVGEIRGLYTITRFKGGGVGKRIIGHLLRVGKRQGLKALFACSSSDKAAAFFERNGFSPVDKGRVPAQKWSSRSSRRRARAFWRDL